MITNIINIKSFTINYKVKKLLKINHKVDFMNETIN
jgi:hypothetical protein